MSTEPFVGNARAYGHSHVIGGLRFVPGNPPTVSEAWGVSTTLTRNGAGDYTVTFKDKNTGALVLASFTENDTTTYHFVRTEALTTTTVQVTHKSVAYADVATGPALSDTVDSITLVFIARGT